METHGQTAPKLGRARRRWADDLAGPAYLNNGTHTYIRLKHMRCVTTLGGIVLRLALTSIKVGFLPHGAGMTRFGGSGDL